MAGLGRRSHYRKHLTDAVLHDLPEPDESIGQRVARVVGTRGGNMFDIVVAAPSSTQKDTADAGESTDHTCNSNTDGIDESNKQSTDADDEPPINNIIQRTPQLAFLPTKFRKLVWIKRNDFVIVECGEEEDEETQQQKKSDKDAGGGFRYVITHILYKDQVKHIKTKGLWPSDPFFADETDSGEKDDDGIEEDGGIHGEGTDNREDGAYEENGIVFDDPLGDDMMMVNTNRIATLRVEDSSSDEDSD